MRSLPAAKPTVHWQMASHNLPESRRGSIVLVLKPTPAVPTESGAAEEQRGATAGDTTATAYQLRESKVPVSRLGRLWNYGGLAAGMLGGALGESISRGLGGGGQGSVMLSASNMERLVSKLSRMRGAALKLGQMLSFQDSKMLPGPLQEVLQRVQDRADYMPSWQRDRVLSSNLGSEWRGLFDAFEEKPIAAASIGQVHRATLRATGAQVAVKIQFPGVAASINSDLDNLAVLLAATKLLPKGLYLDKTIANARTELAWECDYEREAACAQRYRELLADEQDLFLVPRTFSEASGKQVLTMEYMAGTGVTRVRSFTQEQKDWIGTQILRLCLREITEFKFMQTDPQLDQLPVQPADQQAGAARLRRVAGVPRPLHLALRAAAPRRRQVRHGPRPRPLPRPRLPHRPREPGHARRPRPVGRHPGRALPGLGPGALRLQRPDHHGAREGPDPRHGARETGPRPPRRRTACTGNSAAPSCSAPAWGAACGAGRCLPTACAR